MRRLAWGDAFPHGCGAAAGTRQLTCLSASRRSPSLCFLRARSPSPEPVPDTLTSLQVNRTFGLDDVPPEVPPEVACFHYHILKAPAGAWVAALDRVWTWMLDSGDVPALESGSAAGCQQTSFV